MSRLVRDRLRRQLDEAEGYLMLEMPQQALRILDGRPDWASMQFEASLLCGEALRSLGHHREALKPLELAATLRPDDHRVALALGWCYKRTNRLAQAIDAIERAKRANPEEAILYYNLACYWSLAGNLEKAIVELKSALEMEPGLRSLLSGESDFDQLRAHPSFYKLVEPSLSQ